MDTRLQTLGLAVAAASAAVAHAQASDADLAKQLNNPVSSLVSVPFQYNHDDRYGPARDGRKDYVNVQPVIPFSLDRDWNLISRTILPIVSQHDVVPGTSQSGIGDITQSLFFSPKQPGANGVIWGAGPVFLLPTGSDDALSTRKWGIGPTAVLLRQDGPWTYGALMNHIWGAGGSSDHPGVSSTFLQPFLAYATPTGWTYQLNTESTYDWKQAQWSVPVNATVTKLLKIGEQRVSVGGGVRYWTEGPESGPHGWGLRVIVTLLYPK